MVDFFADYEIALRIMARYMPPGPGTSAIFLGGGVPKDFIQITATSVKAIRGDTGPSPHLAAIQITTDNTVFGGLGGASRGERVHLVGQGSGGRRSTSCCFADVTIALPILCQGLLERYGPMHERRARTAIRSDLAALLGD